MSARAPGHLGEWLSPLADGQLPPAQAERALAHVAACRMCAAGLDAERAARRALAAAADVPAAPDLAARLMALSATVPPTSGDPLRERPAAPSPVGATAAPFVAPLSGDLMAAARRRRRRRAIGIGAGGLAVAAMGLFSVGDVPVVVPDPAPAQALTRLARTGDPISLDGTTTPAGAAALTWVDTHGWAGPESIPTGLDVAAVRLVGSGARVLEIDLAGGVGRAVVREQEGRLASGPTRALGGRTVTVLSTAPWHVAWQDGDMVVDVAADVPLPVLEQVVAAFPSGRFDGGVLPRIARGWSAVRSAVVPAAAGR